MLLSLTRAEVDELLPLGLLLDGVVGEDTTDGVVAVGAVEVFCRNNANAAGMVNNGFLVF